MRCKTKIDDCIVWNAHNTVVGSKGSLRVTDWQRDRQTNIPRYSVRCGHCGVIMRNYVGYGKATQSFHVKYEQFRHY